MISNIIMETVNMKKQEQKSFDLTVKKPKALLLGNGLSRAYNAGSWNRFLDSINRKKDEFPKPDDIKIPMPLKIILLTDNHVGTVMKENKGYFLKGFYDELDKEICFQIRKLFDCGFDYILTTNYSYELEYTIYGDKLTFIRSFLYDTENQNSVAYSLERAYDNGIVLREEISTEALSFLQMAKDSLKKSELSSNTRLSLLPLKDILYSFWGCIMDNVYDEEVWNLIFCGKSMERVALYLRLKADFSGINQEFNKLCRRLRFVPKGTPYRCNQKYLCNLVEILEDEAEYKIHSENAMHSLEHLFEVSA